MSLARAVGGGDAPSNLFSTNNKKARILRRRALRDSSAISNSIIRGAKLDKPAVATNTTEAPTDPAGAAAPIITTKFLYDPKATKSNGTNTATAASKASKIAKSAKTKSSKSSPGLEAEASGIGGSDHTPIQLGDQTDGTGASAGTAGNDETTGTILGENTTEVESGDGGASQHNSMEYEEFDDVADVVDGQQGDGGSSSEGHTVDVIDIVDGSEEQSDVVDGTGLSTDLVDGLSGGQQPGGGGSDGQQQMIDEIGGSQGQAFGSENDSNEGQSEEYGLDEQKMDQDESSNGQQIDKAQSSTVPNSKLSTASATFMSLGLAALLTLALLLVIIVKRRRRESYNEFDSDDEHDLRDKNTDIDAASLTSSPNNNVKRAYVVGEEGSVYTGATHDTRFLHASHELGNDNNDDLQVNVHRCASALCPICNGGGLIFVNALDNESTAGVYDPSLEQPHRQDRSYSYKLDKEASVPKFPNPAAEMIERPYIVDNTVAF